MRTLNKVKVWKESSTVAAFRSVVLAILIISIFYFLYFHNRINSNYIVTNVGVDSVVKLTKSDSISLCINKPFDQLYLPVLLCNTNNAIVNISDGEKEISTSISTSQDSVIYYDTNDNNYDFMPDFWNGYNYYYIPEVDISTKEVMNEFIVSMTCDSDNGFLLIGALGDNISYKITKDTHINYWIFFGVLIILIIGTGIISFTFTKYSDAVSRYTIMACILGFVYFILFPAACTNDSRPHITRSYEYVNSIVGHSDWNNIYDSNNYTIYKAEDGYIIDYVLWNTERLYASPDTKMYDEAFYVPFINLPNDDTMVGGWHTNLSDTNLVAYLPYVAVLLVSRLFNINLMFSLNFAKLLGFLCYLIMIRLSIKLMPYGKDALAIFSLTPMIMQNTISISYDLFCIGGTFIAFAYILKISNTEHHFTWKDLSLILFLGLTLASVKHGIYLACAIFLVFFLIVVPKIISKPKYGLFLIAILVLLGLLVSLKFNDIEKLVMGGEVDTYSVHDLIENPIGIMRFIIVSIITDSDMLIQGIFGGRLGWNEVVVPWFTLIAFIVLFLLSCLSEENHFPKKKEQIVSIITIILLVLGIYIIFLRMTSTTTETIFGVQGRYFIPLIPLFICFIKNKKLYINCKTTMLYNSLWFVSIIHILMMMTVYIRR